MLGGLAVPNAPFAAGLEHSRRKISLRKFQILGTRTQTSGHPQKGCGFRGCSEQDDKRFRFHLGRPRAVAHGWGKRARICTEINRLPRLTRFFPRKKQGNAEEPFWSN